MTIRNFLLGCGAVALGGVLTLGAVPEAHAAVGSVRAVTALGDSYPSGAMGNEGNSYVERYGRRSAQRSLNWSHSGWRTGDVLYQLQNNPVEVRNLRDSRTVVITIGANDIAQTFPNPALATRPSTREAAELKAMRTRLHAVLGTVSRARGGSNGRVVVTTYNNIYMDGRPLARQSYNYRIGAVRLTRAVNSVIMAECTAYRMACVDVYSPFHMNNPNAMVVYDGTHPNATGHQFYANMIYNKVH